MGLRTKAALLRPERWRTSCGYGTRTKLFRLTRAELFGLHRDIAAALAVMPDSESGAPGGAHEFVHHSSRAGTAEPRPLVRFDIIERCSAYERYRAR